MGAKFKYEEKREKYDTKRSKSRGKSRAELPLHYFYSTNAVIPTSDSYVYNGVQLIIADARDKSETRVILCCSSKSGYYINL